VLTIKAITFDFWATLYQSKTIDYTKRINQLKQAVEQRSGANFEMPQFKAAIKVARNAWGRAWTEEHRTMSANEWLGVMLNELEISLSPEHLSEIKINMENSALNDWPILASEARAALADLSSHYQLAIISDTGITPGRVLRQILKKDGLFEHFTHLTFSDEVGRSKPHSDVFLTTLKALGANPQQAVHVGDLLRTDIAGAQAVGMRAVQYTGINQDGQSDLVDVSIPAVTPDAVIKNLMELKPLLQQWNGGGPG
jgi:putative hydrolase of the HAD superfamily